jgi:hypothetical protein
MRGLIVVAGSLAQKPGFGGHAWVFLQYLLGFRRLGWEVLFLDVLGPPAWVDEAGAACPPERSRGLCYLVEVMERFGLKESFALFDDRGQSLAGQSRGKVLEQVRRSACLLNVMGYLRDDAILGQAPRCVFLDIDPGFGQMWKELGLADVFAGHDAYVTIGENIGQPDCAIPLCGLHWIATPQPVVLEHWPVRAGIGERWWTSIVSWRGAYGPIEYQGRTYGLRVHEFRRFLGLPRRTGRRFELALDIHPDETKDLASLQENRWSLVDPREVAGDPWAYQGYIQKSDVEFLVAKNMYVQARSGWLSDRSLCYLASGKPVLAQDTGFGRLYPTGEGLLKYGDVDGAVAGVEQVCSDYPRHAKAARALAEAYFDSDKVLSRLLTQLGIS